MKKLVFAVAAAALVSLGAVGTVAQAQPRVDAQIYLGAPPPVIVAPPPPVYVRPAPIYYGPPPPPDRRFYDRHHAQRWDQRHGGYYRRDRDGDGVPNRYDRRPDNPYRY
ncbi:hypothetical protein WKW79_32405 [Variovorax robiniae]|uniref:Uncharacterized protein n=1 Tax=Variovorax robiniae TaxID=1836199 RepID=A0ABU8XJY0_9BURK